MAAIGQAFRQCEWPPLAGSRRPIARLTAAVPPNRGTAITWDHPSICPRQTATPMLVASLPGVATDDNRTRACTPLDRGWSDHLVRQEHGTGEASRHGDVGDQTQAQAR